MKEGPENSRLKSGSVSFTASTKACHWARSDSVETQVNIWFGADALEPPDPDEQAPNEALAPTAARSDAETIKERREMNASM